MKTYKLNNVEVSEDQVRELIKSNPELLEKKEIKGRYYFPKVGEMCYDYFSNGTVSEHFYMNGHENSGVFKTREDAKLAYDKQCAIVRCWKWAQENAPFEPDWKNHGQHKFFVFYDHKNKETATWSTVCIQYQFTLPYFKSQEDCKSFIEANKADLELLFLK